MLVHFEQANTLQCHTSRTKTEEEESRQETVFLYSNEDKLSLHTNIFGKRS